MAGSAAVVVELSLWSVTYVRPVEAVVVLGDYMAYSNQRRNADLLSAVCNPGVWMWLLPRWCWWLAGEATWRVKGFHALVAVSNVLSTMNADHCNGDRLAYLAESAVDGQCSCY